MGISNMIEQFLKEMLDDNGGHVEIGRNELADQFNCAPSQINYVLTTRFAPYQGYYIESRRGGSGFIRIVKLTNQSSYPLEETIQEGIGESLTKDQAVMLAENLKEEGVLEKREFLILCHATDDLALKNVPVKVRNKIRADIFKNILFAFLR